METLKYNFVIAGGTGFYDAAYSGLKNLPNVRYHSSMLSGVTSKLIRFLIRINFNLKLNRLIRTPFRRIVYKHLYPCSFNNSNPICFIFFESHFAVINTSFITYLKEVYPTAKIVLYMQDIIASLPYYNVEDYRNKFDLIVSYDKGDCDKYAFLYHPTPFSRIDFQISEEEIDVFFCGAAKTRYKTILDTYSRLTNNGLKCKFYITGVPEEFRIQGEGLYYDHPITYLQNLKYVAQSKCILEVMQVNADGFTPRLWEAIMYDKHLLTNNSYIQDSIYWNPQAIHLLDDCGDFSFIKEKISYSNDIKITKSPINLLHFIEQNLC